MTRRIAAVSHRFVRYIPEQLDAGVIYVSIEYRVATHLCCCGCGEKVVTPLSAAQWALIYNGETVSLTPSISGGACNSHYFITHDRARWERPLTRQQTALASRRDHAAAARRYGTTPGAEAPPVEVAPRSGPWWRRLRKRLQKKAGG